MAFTPIPQAVVAFAAGGGVVILDDEDRENEGDLILSAVHADPAAVAFFLRHTSGLLCTAISEERAQALDLPLMVRDNTERHRTAFTISVDYRHGTGTGISAADRSATIRALAAPATRPADLTRPGHMLPLRARPGGVLKRAGHTEAAVDLCTLAGLPPAALLCELVTPDRTGMLARDDVLTFAAEHDLPVITIADLVKHRRRMTPLVTRSGEAEIPTPDGVFHAISYRSDVDGVEHVALVLGSVRDSPAVPVRVHSECLTGDTFTSLRCDCGPQLRAAMSLIAAGGCGIVVYLRGHEGRGIGIGHKLRAYELQQRFGLDTIDANLELGLPVDTREYGIGAQILLDLGVRGIRLMTNNPDKYTGLAAYGLQIVDRIPLQTAPTPQNIVYLTTKRDRLGHLLDLPVSQTGHRCDSECRVSHPASGEGSDGDNDATVRHHPGQRRGAKMAQARGAIEELGLQHPEGCSR